MEFFLHAGFVVQEARFGQAVKFLRIIVIDAQMLSAKV